MSYLDFPVELTNSVDNRILASQGASLNTGPDLRTERTPTLGMKSQGISDDMNMTAKEMSAWKKRNKSIAGQDAREKNNLTTAPQRLGNIASANESGLASDQTMAHIVSPMSPLKP